MTISEQIALAPMFYLGQVFVFSELINKKVLEWFLLIMCKERNLSRSTNFLSKNRDLQNRITHHDVTNQVTNSKSLLFKIFELEAQCEKNCNIILELLTRKF